MKEKNQTLVGAKEVAMALWVILGLFVFSIFWSLIFPLESAAIAPGKIALSSLSKKVQHPYGGLVVALYAFEGDLVKKGDPLLRIDDEKQRKERDLIQKKLQVLNLLKTRLEAEQKESSFLTLGKEILQHLKEKKVQDFLSIQIQLFEKNVQLHLAHIALLEKRVENLAVSLERLEKQIVWVDKQKGIADEEVFELEDLVQKGLVGKPRLLALKRESARLQSEHERLQVAVAATKKEQDDARLNIQATLEKYQKEIFEALEETETKIIEEEQKLGIAETVIERSVLESPISGIIYGLTIHEVGEVVKGGDVIAQVVPIGGQLTIEAHVSPLDIDMVAKGQRAVVTLRPFNPRRLHKLEGIVQYISPNTLFDEKLRVDYYTVHVLIKEDQVKTLDINPLPGMPAEVVIINDRRTLFQYIYDPIYQSFYRAFREN